MTLGETTSYAPSEEWFLDTTLTLASHTGWTEAALFAMPYRRYRKYLQRLSKRTD